MSRGKITLVVALALASMVLAQSWSFTFQVEPVPGQTHDLEIAMTAGATAGYDAFLDVPYFTPPDGRGVFFPLNDPLNPAYTKLQKDVRGIALGSYTYWIAMDEGYWGLDDRMVRWDIDNLPDPDISGNLWIAPIVYGTDPATLDEALWIPMNTVEEFGFGPTQEAAFRFMPSAMVDTIAPYVTGFDPVPGEAGVSTAKNVRFDVKDANRGVDPATIDVWVTVGGGTPAHLGPSDMILDPIVGGYRVTIPPVGGAWPESTIINYTVNACDLASPANCMDVDTSVSFFTRVIPPDMFPPYFETAYPANGATDVDVTSCVRIVIKDSESGVDSSTIIFQLNGTAIPHSDLNITELGVGSDWYRVEYCPTSDLNYGAIYNVNVYAEDFWGNDASITWSFVTEEADSLPEFVYNLQAISISGTDTARTNLYIGLDNLGTDGYDVGLDVPQFLFPGAPRGYFPLMDPSHPSVPALSRDIRSTSHGIKTWTVDMYSPVGTLKLTWDRLLLPPIGMFSFAVVDSGSTPSAWTSMSTYGEVSFTSSQQVLIRFLPTLVDPNPPVVTNVSMEGSGPGGVGYDPATPLCFSVVDYESGVDISSVAISIDYVDIDLAEFATTPLSNGYRFCYTPSPMWSPNTTYRVEVQAADNAIPANEIDPPYVWNFSTGPAGCAPLFELPLTFTWGAGADENETIIFGTHEGASPGYDAGLDQIQPPPITAAGFFFTCGDAAPADKLIKDLRNPCDRPNIWQASKRNLLTSPNVTVTWPTSPVFADTSWHIYYKVLGLGVTPPTAVDSTWTRMNVGDEIVYNANSNYLYVGLGYIGTTIEVFNIEGDVAIAGAPDNSGIRVYLNGGTFRTTNAAGEYSFANIPLGTYNLTFWDPAGEYCAHPDMDSIVVVTGTVPDATIDVPTYHMLPCGSRRVYGVGSVAGTPTQWINVKLTNLGDLSESTIPTNASGAYQFLGVVPGDYMLTASYSGYRTWDTTFTVGLTDVNINFNLTETTVLVTGMARLNSVPSPGITINGSAVATPTTSIADGSYSVTANIGGGNICASYPGYETVCQFVTVPETGLTGVDFNLLPLPVDVIVSVDLGCETVNMSGASVTMSGVGTEITPASGNVRFDDVAHGWYNFTVSAPYHATVVVESVYVSADTTINVALCCLDAVEDFDADPDSVARPTADPLTIALSWTEAGTSCCDPDSYLVYRSLAPFISTTAPGVTRVASVPFGTTTYVDATVADGVRYYYDIVVVYGCPSNYSRLAGNVNAASAYTPDPADYLVIDWDNGATPTNGGTMGVGEWWVNMLGSSALGLSAVVRTTDDSHSDPLAGYNLNDYDLVVLALGINDADNTVLPTAAVAKLEAYRAISGKKMIIEGPDFGADYNATTFFGNLGLAFVHDGAADFNVDWFYATPTLTNASFPIIFDYNDSSSADHFVDILNSPGVLTTNVAWDQDSVYRTFFYNGPCQTIISTIYLGGIVNSSYPYVQSRAASGYLWKLGIANTGIYQVETKLPSDFALAGNYPNPFNPVTTIEFQLPRDSHVDVSIYDITGKRVETLVDERLEGGVYKVAWNANNMPSGVYFARMTAGEFSATHKVMLVK